MESSPTVFHILPLSPVTVSTRADVVHSFIEAVQVSQLIKHISPSTSVLLLLSLLLLLLDSAHQLQWAKNCNEISTACWSPWSIPWKKQKTKTATIESIIISFFRVLFSIIYGLLYISQLCGLSVRLSVYGGVCACVGGCCPWRHCKKLACKTSWPFVSVANNNRANHLNDITRKWNVNNSLCHPMRERNWQRDTL